MNNNIDKNSNDDLKQDPTLREASEWFSSDAPGAERVEQLAIPALPTRLPMRKIFKYAAQAAAAAAIFVMGFTIGAGTEPISDSPPTTSQQEQQVQPKHIPSAPIGERPDMAQMAHADNVQVEEKDGRITYQTNRGVWVVDGTFRIQ
jgi:hypothetical protein